MNLLTSACFIVGCGVQHRMPYILTMRFPPRQLATAATLGLFLSLWRPSTAFQRSSSFALPAGRTAAAPTYRAAATVITRLHHRSSRPLGRGEEVAAANDSDEKTPPAVARAGGKLLALVTRRTAARVAFAGTAVLGPALALRRRASPQDLGLFLVTAAALTLADAARREWNRVVVRIKRWREGIAKHSTLDPREIFSTESSADRVTLIGVVVNLVLSIGKAVVGVKCHSQALVADAGHSLSDLFSDFITLAAVQVGRLPPDDDHPYGHGKFEAMGSLFLAMTLVATGLSVGAASGQKLAEIIASRRAGTLGSLSQKVPTGPALLMAVASILSKEWLYRVTRRVGEALNSQVVIANAWHHRSDAYSSVLSSASIAAAMMGLLAADAAAGILVAGMICATGAEIFGESVKQLTDTVDERLVRKVKKIIKKSNDKEDVLEVKRIRARQVGSSSLVDVSITTPEGLSSTANRAIEERLRWAIMEEPGVIDADVRAAPPAGTDETICPLLAAEEVRGNVQKPPSTTTVEEDVRRVLGKRSEVKSIKGVTVNYRDTMLVDVDCVIRVDPELTVQQANLLAADLKLNLEREDDIDRANIFLDLNEAATVASLST